MLYQLIFLRLRLLPFPLCSCVSLDVFEWRSMQLEEALPVPSRLHRSTLPVSSPASPGSARQRAACVPRSFKARRPEICGVEHKPQPVYTHVVNVNLQRPLITAGASLLRRYLSSASALLTL